jgi:hypothetical protein
MAHFDDISPKLRKKVAQEIADFIDKTPDEDLKDQPPPKEPDYKKALFRRKAKEEHSEIDDEDAPLQLGDSLTVWKFSKAAFQRIAESRLPGDLSNWVARTHTVHHQIWFKGKVAGFARSYDEERLDETTLFHLTASSLAEEVNKLIEAVERNESGDEFLDGDPVVRLLDIPPFQVYSLWLFSEPLNESRVAIINAPRRYKFGRGALLNSTQFLDALSDGGLLLEVI